MCVYVYMYVYTHIYIHTYILRAGVGGERHPGALPLRPSAAGAARLRRNE